MLNRNSNEFNFFKQRKENRNNDFLQLPIEEDMVKYIYIYILIQLTFVLICLLLKIYIIIRILLWKMLKQLT